MTSLHKHLQTQFWFQAQSLGFYAQTEAYLEGAGYADLVVWADLLATRPVLVAEFKERLTWARSVTDGAAQARRYQKWLRKTTGISPLAYIVAPELPALEERSLSWPRKPEIRGVYVLDAAEFAVTLDRVLRAQRTSA